MTSNTMPPDKGSSSLVTKPNGHSTGLSGQSSNADQLAALTLRLKRQEENKVASALSSLKAFEGPALLPFEEYRTFCETNHALYLGKILGRHCYINRSTDPAAIRRVVDDLRTGRELPEHRVALYSLWLCTKHEKMNGEDRNAMLTLYCRNLAAYPVEAVKVVIMELVETSTFFPAWSEIAEKLTRHTRQTSDLVTALRIAHIALNNFQSGAPNEN